MRDLTAQQKMALETLVDDTSLYRVVLALSDMSAEKSEHVLSAWQDARTAKPWRYAARKLLRSAAFIRDLGV